MLRIHDGGDAVMRTRCTSTGLYACEGGYRFCVSDNGRELAGLTEQTKAHGAYRHAAPGTVYFEVCIPNSTWCSVWCMMCRP